MPTLNIDMVDVKDTDYVYDINNLNVVYSSTPVTSLLHITTEIGGKRYKILLTSWKST